MPVTHRLRAVSRDDKCQEPTSANAEITLSYDGAGNMVQMDRTIGVITYRRVYTYDGSGNLTNISSWVKL